MEAPAGGILHHLCIYPDAAVYRTEIYVCRQRIDHRRTRAAADGVYRTLFLQRQSPCLSLDMRCGSVCRHCAADGGRCGRGWRSRLVRLFSGTACRNRFLHGSPPDSTADCPYRRTGIHICFHCRRIADVPAVFACLGTELYRALELAGRGVAAVFGCGVQLVCLLAVE